MKFKKGDILTSKNHNYHVEVIEMKNDFIFSGEVIYSEHELYKSGQIVENFCADFFEEVLF